MKKKILICVLCLTFFLSVSINIYYFLPHKVSESVSMGYYVSDYTNGEFYKLSIMQDNQVKMKMNTESQRSPTVIRLWHGMIRYSYRFTKTEKSTASY